MVCIRPQTYFHCNKSVCIAFGPMYHAPIPDMSLGTSKIACQSSVKYLGLALISDPCFKVDTDGSKRKFSRCNAVLDNSAHELDFGATVCKTVRPMLSVRCLSVLSVCNVRALWSNGWTDQDETWHAGRPRPWPHCVRWGPSSPSHKGAQPPPNLRSNGCMGQDATWYGARPQPRRLGVRWRPRSTLPKKRHSPSIFGPYPLRPNGCIDQDATWYGGRPGPGRLCVKWRPSPPPKFSVHVYYSYSDFVRTLHRRKALLVSSSSS